MELQLDSAKCPGQFFGVGSCEQPVDLNVLILILIYYYLIGENVCQLHELYKCIQLNLFWKHLISVKEKPQRRQDIVDSALLETYHVRAAQ